MNRRKLFGWLLRLPALAGLTGGGAALYGGGA